jgi:hypothetical protein
MKKLLMICTVIFSLNIIAQETEEIKIGNMGDAKLKTFKYRETADTVNPWNITGNVNIGFAQTALVNWAPGGNNIIGVNGLAFMKAAYDKRRLNWTSTIDLGYGMQKINKENFRKSDDRLELNTQLSYKIKENRHWYYSLMANFRTQMAPGYNFVDDTTRLLVSKGLSPGYLTAGIGFDYKPTDWFNVFISPIASKTVFVLDNVNIDETQYGIDSGKHVFQALGAFLSTRLSKEVVKNVTINTQLNLFSNYLKNPQNIDINWLTSINLKVNKFLSVAIITEFVYDDDVNVPKKRKDGTTYQGKGGQFRESLTIGLGYQFNNEKRQPKKP